jgi:hypothetical protein
MFLADLSVEELFREVARNRFPKWSSMCLLRAVGAPTLEALLIEPIESSDLRKAVYQSIQAFQDRTKANRVMLRTDRQRETKSYLRGGNSYTFEKAVEVAIEIAETGRTLIILEPTDRLTNQLTISIAVEPDGRWCAELLGPGFDASNLQRGDVPPEYIVSGLPLDGVNASNVGEHQIRISRLENISMKQRITLRLAGIVTHILPSYGVDLRSQENSSQLASDWMRSNGYNLLFRNEIARFPSRAFSTVFETAQLVFHYRRHNRSSSSFVLASSVLTRSRMVFWDVTDGQKKWGSG